MLSRLSHARPKIADYPFTTLHPQLGVVRLDDETEFVLADLPGLIEGASEGAGLGTRFLGHVERCAVILHLIDGTEEDVVGAYRTIRRELADYGHGLADKPEIVGLNKIDAIDPAEVDEEAPGAGRAPRGRARRCWRSPGSAAPVCRTARHAGRDDPRSARRADALAPDERPTRAMRLRRGGNEPTLAQRRSVGDRRRRPPPLAGEGRGRGRCGVPPPRPTAGRRRCSRRGGSS